MPRLHSRGWRLDGAAPPAQQGCVRGAGAAASRRPLPGFPAHRRAVVGALRSAPPRKARHA